MRSIWGAVLALACLVAGSPAWATINGCGGGDVYVPSWLIENFTSLQIDPSAEPCPNGWVSFGNFDVDGQAVIGAGDSIYAANAYSDAGSNGLFNIHPGGVLEVGVFQQGPIAYFVLGGLFQLDNPAQSTGGYIMGSSNDNASNFCTAGYCATPQQIANGLMVWPTPLTGGPTTYETHIIWSDPAWNNEMLQVAVDDGHYHWGAWSTMACVGASYLLQNTDAPWLQHGYHYLFRVGYAATCSGMTTETNRVAVNP